MNKELLYTYKLVAVYHKENIKLLFVPERCHLEITFWRNELT